jgi:NhaP-type Na+/H+ and K+/H+ antiporter
MYKYIGLLHEPTWYDPPRLSDGFILNGNSSLQSLAQFYGLKPPAAGPRLTLANYLARACYGQPRVGERTVWERVELVVEEMQGQAISKVRIAILPLHERRGPGGALGDPRAWKDRRSPEPHRIWQ